MRRKPGGIALLVVVGILTLLLVIGTTFVRIAAFGTLWTGRHLDHAVARTLARSGIEYAFSRIAQTPSPKPGFPADDWTFRDDPMTPLEEALNVSYLQGEQYEDRDDNRRYDPGVDAYVDANGNGRFDGWSGRLRGRNGALGATFALRIDPGAGRVNINGGVLGLIDVNQDGDPHDYRQPGYRWMYGTSGFAWDLLNDTGLCSFDTLYGLVDQHWRIADTLNIVGRLVGAEDPRVGTTLIRNRPLGGYLDLDAVGAALSPGDRRKILPFVSTAAQDAAWFRNSCGDGRPPLPRRRQLLNLEAAPWQVLQASFEGLAWGIGVFPTPTTISEVEAKSLADFLKGNLPFVGPRFRSWVDLFRRLNQDRLLVFPSGDPYLINSKVNIAMANAIPETLYNQPGGSTGAFRFPPYPQPFSWFSFDEPRMAYEGGETRMGRDPSGYNLFKRVTDPPSDTSGATGLLYNQHAGIELSLTRGDGVFTLRSLGRVSPGGSERGRSEAFATLLLKRQIAARSQVDFDNAETSVPLYDRNSSMLAPSKKQEWRYRADPGAGVRIVGAPSADRIETGPVFLGNRSFARIEADGFQFQPYWGDLRLMDYSGYLYRDALPSSLRWGQGEAFYAPFWTIRQPLRTDDSDSFWESLRDIAGGTPCTSHDSSDTDLYPGYVTPVFVQAAAYFWLMAPSAGVPTYNPAAFPLIDPPESGRVPRGTWEEFPGRSHYSAGALGTGTRCGNPMKVTTSFIGSNDMSSPMGQMLWQGGGETLLTAKIYNVCDWHHVAFAFSEEDGLRGYFDGIPDPGLSGDYAPNAGSMASAQNFTINGDEVRLYRGRLDSFVIQAHAMEPRYWLSDYPVPGDIEPLLKARLAPVPSFLSPLYVTPRISSVTGARWDGFVPRALIEAADGARVEGSRGAVPLSVELLLYAGQDGRDEPKVIRLPDDFFRDGGGWADFPWERASAGNPYRNVRAFRYRVTMDASACQDQNGALRETPVFDAITVFVHYGGTLATYSQD